MKKRGKRPKPLYLSSPISARRCWPKGYYHYGCLKDYDTAIRYFEQARQLLPNDSRIPESLAYVTRRRGQWEQSEFYFNEAERLDVRNGNLLTQHALSYMRLRRFPEALRKLDQVLNITPDDVRYRCVQGEHRTSPRRSAASRERSSLRFIQTQTIPAPWKHKFTKRSWSAVLHQSSPGCRKYWTSLIPSWVI